MAGSGARLLSVDFEVFGLVQGVFFRKYTKMAAEENKLVGWCLNTRDDTVKGQMQGAPDGIGRMKEWLRRTGSPASRIERAEFTNEREISNLEYKNFAVKH